MSLKLKRRNFNKNFKMKDKKLLKQNQLYLKTSKNKKMLFFK